MKRYLTIVLGLVLSAGALNAQDWPFELWHEGKVVLSSGDTLKGLVKYDLQQDIVQFEFPNERKEAFTARKVFSFSIFDATVHLHRQFYALPYQAKPGYKSPVFFELLAEGEITLLCREALENRTISSPYYLGSYTRVVLVYRYFLLEADGEVVAFDAAKQDFLKRMGKLADEVDKYARHNKLKYDNPYDLAKIVNHYNGLVGK